MNLKKKNNTKKGLFLSVELIVIIIVIALIIAIVVAGLAALIRSYKIFRISRDVAIYSEAVTSFKHSQYSLPGDIAASQLSGLLNNPTINDYISNISSSATITNTIAKTSGNGTISQFKSIVAFSQLKALNMIPQNAVQDSIVLPLAAEAIAGMTFLNLANNYLPIASFDKNLMWVLVSDLTTTDNLQTSALQVGTNYAKYDDNWSGVPRLVLIKHSEASTETLPYDWTKAVASLSPNMLAAYDVKFDDGLPYGKTSKIIGESVNIAGGLSCNSIGAVITSLTPQNDFLNANYNRSKATSGMKACIPIFGIYGTED